MVVVAFVHMKHLAVPCRNNGKTVARQPVGQRVGAVIHLVYVDYVAGVYAPAVCRVEVLLFQIVLAVFQAFYEVNLFFVVFKRFQVLVSLQIPIPVGRFFILFRSGVFVPVFFHVHVSVYKFLVIP